MALLDMVRRRLDSNHDAALDARLRAVEAHIRALYDHAEQSTRELQQLRQDELRRTAEHSTMIDALTRLYKRVAQRILRENGAVSDPPVTREETVMELQRRLGKR